MTKTEPRSAGSGGGRDKTQPTPTELLASLAFQLEECVFQVNWREVVAIAKKMREMSTTLSAREDLGELAAIFTAAHKEHAEDKIPKVFARGQREEANVIVGLRAVFDRLWASNGGWQQCPECDCNFKRVPTKAPTAGEGHA